MKFVRLYLRCLKCLWMDDRGLTVLLAGLAMVVGLIQLAEPVMFGRVIDALSKQSGVLRILLIWAAFGGVNIAFSVYLGVMSDRLAHRQRLKLLERIVEKTVDLPIGFHAQQGTGRITHSIWHGLEQLFLIWLLLLREHLSALTGILFLVPVAMFVDWRMASLLFGLASVYLIANSAVVRHTHVLQQKIEDYHLNVSSRVGDLLGNVTVVQSYARVRQEIQELAKLTARLLGVQNPVLTWWGFLSVITRISSAVAMVSILALGSWLVGQGRLSVGAVVSFIGFSSLLIAKLDHLSSFLSRTAARAPTLLGFFDLMDKEGATPDRPNARELSHVRGDLEFRGVCFQHKGSANGVFDLSFKVAAGQTIALVGPSGAGKTTTVALLQRLFDPQQGSILIDGHDIRDLKLNSLRHGLATVFQDAGLFNRSIQDNIRVGRLEASEAEVIDAAILAEAHEFIIDKPGKYDFVIGERGGALSGGERQRLGIARAILKAAPILIFDEATSALDNYTEKKIQQALTRLRAQEKTTLIIAHRLSTVASADHILVFDQGRIVEQGSFASLRLRGGLFAQLLKMGELGPPPELPPIEAAV